MPAQYLRLAHHLDIHRLPDIDPVELGLFEITIDAERMQVHHRQHRASRRHVFARTRRAIVEITIDGTHDRRALQIEPRGIDSDIRIRQRRFRRLHARVAFLGHFTRDEVAERAVAGVFATRLIERCAALQRRGLRLAQRECVARLIDDEQHLAGVHRLVVDHVHAHDQAAHVRRHLHDVGAHMAVAGPGREHVVVDQPPQHERGDRHDDERKEDLSNGEPGFFHDDFTVIADAKQ